MAPCPLLWTSTTSSSNTYMPRYITCARRTQHLDGRLLTLTNTSPLEHGLLKIRCGQRVLFSRCSSTRSRWLACWLVAWENNGVEQSDNRTRDTAAFYQSKRNGILQRIKWMCPDAASLLCRLEAQGIEEGRDRQSG